MVIWFAGGCGVKGRQSLSLLQMLERRLLSYYIYLVDPRDWKTYEDLVCWKHKNKNM